MTAPARTDAYTDYTRRFFGRWASVYNLFAATIAPVYGRAARCLDPAPGRTILDVCTGTGAMAGRCARLGASVTAIDMTAAMLDRARRRNAGLAIEFEQLDARWLPYPDESFDASVISLGLHDMPRRVRHRVLAEMLRVTRDRIVVVDYDFTRAGRLAGTLARMGRTFETAYYPQFVATGPARLLTEAGCGRSLNLAPPWPWSWFFSIHVVDPEFVRRTR